MKPAVRAYTTRSVFCFFVLKRSDGHVFRVVLDVVVFRGVGHGLPSESVPIRPTGFPDGGFRRRATFRRALGFRVGSSRGGGGEKREESTPVTRAANMATVRFSETSRVVRRFRTLSRVQSSARGGAARVRIEGRGAVGSRSDVSGPPGVSDPFVSPRVISHGASSVAVSRSRRNAEMPRNDRVPVVSHVPDDDGRTARNGSDRRDRNAQIKHATSRTDSRDDGVN